MKSAIAAVILLWTVLCLEMALHQSSAWFSQGALLIPFSCGIVFWMRSAAGIATATSALLLSWIAFPVGPPLASLVMPLIAALLLLPAKHAQSFRRSTWWQRCCPAPLHLSLFTLTMILLQQIARATETLASWEQMAVAEQVAISLNQFLRTAVIAIPISAGLALFLFAADELGLRRRATDGFL